MSRTARRLWLIAGGLLLLYSVPSILFMGFVNAGNFALAGLGAAAVCTPFLYARLGTRGKRFCAVLWSLALCGMAALTGVMLYTAHIAVPKPESPPGTVVVLGAMLRDNEPSLLLEKRLATALSYLNEHPEANAIVSGGLGEDELFTEAEVMKRWLVEHGANPARIYEEAAATVTSENLAFSAALIRKHGLDTQVAICTDGYHQLRAAVFARKNGLTPSSLSSPTPPGLIPMYYVREWFGLVKAVIFGH